MVISKEHISVEGGAIQVRTIGEGPPLLFAHGLLVNSHVWDDLIPLLSEQYRLILPDLPFGGHWVPLDSDADRSLAAHARRLIALAEKEGRPVTLVGNDTGGAVAQLAVIQRPDLFSRLILLPSDAFDNCPPKPLFLISVLPAIPGASWLLGQEAKIPIVQRALLRLVAARLPEQNRLEALLGGFTANAGVRRDTMGLIANMHPSVTTEAAKHLSSYRKPVKIIWSRDDLLFPEEHAHRLADLFPNSDVELVNDAQTYIALDQPEVLASSIRAFVP
eukprot:s1_g214.t1